MKPGEVPQSGPAPVLMRLEDWHKVVPTYLEMAMAIERSESAKHGLGECACACGAA